MSAQHSVKLVPWDDQAFVRAYEAAAAELAHDGRQPRSGRTLGELQRRLRGQGYLNATCYASGAWTSRWRAGHAAWYRETAMHRSRCSTSPLQH